ncbi:terminal uridylyltransferase 7-like isoform X2 [Panicum miliaceum]|uniref:Terminal uridylyltransferase 7-like isoform X2 n=1 Tax=Panicum miliaceum TaxID=4540 RepID=A0A3L6PPS0_PANMI|nr:terminal uridylyltransferase 7-like isoform X2 [Panicum miliaceum]
MESKACVIDLALLPTLEGLLLETYASLQPKPVDYGNRQVMINVFNKIAEQIFGKKNGLPVVEAFGSFTMDLFTPESDLDLSVNFNTDTKDLYPRKDKINAIRKLTKILYSHQRHGRCYGVLPISTARVPVLKVTDQGTGVECDISIENKDGMSRSMIIKFISSIDERFRILCYLMKFWAKAHDVNSPKDQTMSSMSIISLVAFHLQTRRPPILPAFSAILKDGSDYASIEKNVSLFKGFGSSNKESIAELFVSMMIKLLSVEGLWEQGLCASNFEGSWISKTWGKGVGNLSVEDFLDQSQNFARCVGMGQMRTICECLRATVSDLSKFFMGKIAAPKLKALLSGPLNQVKPVTDPIQKTVKRKRVNPNKTSTSPSQRNAKKKKPLEQNKPVISPGQRDDKKPLDQKPVSSPIQKDANRNKPLDQDKPTISPGQKDDNKPFDQDKLVISPVQKVAKKKSSNVGHDSGSSQVQQKKAKVTVYTSGSRPPSVIPPQRMHRPVLTQPIINQFAHITQHPITPPAFGYGLPPPHLHSAYHHPHQGLVGQPQGDFLHLYPGIQLQHQGQAMFAPPPPAAHHPVLHGLHPYGSIGAQQMQHTDNRLVQRPPYGMRQGFWR